MKNNQNKLILISATMLAVIFMTSGCEFESAGAESKDPYQATPLLPSCDDGIDNNGDGNTDLADSGCDPNGDGIYDDATGEFYLPYCNDGVDNDSTGADGIAGTGDEDGLIDLDDPDCRLSEDGTGENFIDAPVLPSFCEDGLDNDLDGDTDLEDSDCVVGGSGETPAAPKNNCADDIDNDGDGFTDALDIDDCTGDGLGESYLPNCDDDVDNDGDGDPDLEDSDCDASAGGTGEYALDNCADGADNDGDDLFDLDDPDCRLDSDPPGTGEFAPPIEIPPAVENTNESVEDAILEGEVSDTSQAGRPHNHGGGLRIIPQEIKKLFETSLEL